MQANLFSTDLSEGDVVIDVGAHSGQYTLQMAACCGFSARLIAFELDSHAIELLERLNSRTKCNAI